MDVARPKEFDRDVALLTAIDVFADRGYEGTSTEALLKATGLSRQSLYDTYGSKRALYLEALERYNYESAVRIVQDITNASTPLAGLENALLSHARHAAEQPNAACLGVSSVFEFGLRDPEVMAASNASHAILLEAITDALERGRACGELRHDVDANSGADFLLGVLAGIKVSARGGMSVERLQQMAQLAMQALRS